VGRHSLGPGWCLVVQDEPGQDFEHRQGLFASERQLLLAHHSRLPVINSFLFNYLKLKFYLHFKLAVFNFSSCLLWFSKTLNHFSHTGKNFSVKPWRQKASNANLDSVDSTSPFQTFFRPKKWHNLDLTSLTWYATIFSKTFAGKEVHNSSFVSLLKAFHANVINWIVRYSVFYLL
jgi:hypothetical protein